MTCTQVSASTVSQAVEKHVARMMRISVSMIYQRKVALGLKRIRRDAQIWCLTIVQLPVRGELCQGDVITIHLLLSHNQLCGELSVFWLIF